MGFFKENKHVDGTTSTDWGGSIVGGMGGIGGFGILIAAAMFLEYWVYIVALLVIVLILWGLWKLLPQEKRGKYFAYIMSFLFICLLYLLIAPSSHIQADAEKARLEYEKSIKDVK